MVNCSQFSHTSSQTVLEDIPLKTFIVYQNSAVKEKMINFKMEDKLNNILLNLSNRDIEMYNDEIVKFFNGAPAREYSN